MRITMNLRRSIRSSLAGFLLAIGVSTLACPLLAEEPANLLPSGERHRIFRADMPPGAIGMARLTGRGPLAGYYQPVAFSGPPGVKFSLPNEGKFDLGSDSLRAGMLIGAVYRFRITNIPLHPGAELYPTIEVIDRTYPPQGLAHKYPIPINLDEDDLRAALEGKMVTRIVLLEDPQTALAIPRSPEHPGAIEVAENQDALEVADRFGRPVAIVRLGSLTPPNSPVLMPQFFFGYPTWAPMEANKPEPTTTTALQNNHDLARTSK